jgi:hypothetical protein
MKMRSEWVILTKYSQRDKEESIVIREKYNEEEGE